MNPIKDSQPMSLRSRVAHVGGGIALGLALAGGGYAVAASSSGDDIHGCIARNHALLIQRRCGRGQRRLVFAAHGPVGARGVTGASGPLGPTGPQGPPGKDGVALWARVDAAGRVVAQSGQISVGKVGTGAYQITPGVYEGPCSVVATPFSLSFASSEPVTTQIETTGTGPGAAIVVRVFTARTLAETDDAFSIMVQCAA